MTEEENFNNSEDKSDDDTEDGNYENQRKDDESYEDDSQRDNEAEDERNSENLPRASVSNSENFVTKTKKSYFEWMKKKPLIPGTQNLSTEASLNSINTISPEPTGAEKTPKRQ